MKILETIAGKTYFKVKVFAIDTSNNEEMIILSSDYHLTCDKIRRRIITYQKYGYVGLSSYDLNIFERFQNS